MYPVHLPQEQVNDESVLLVEWLLADGHAVKAGQPIAVIETSKATTQIEAPRDGFLRHNAASGVEVAVGAVFCHIANTADELVCAEPSSVAGNAALQNNDSLKPENPTAPDGNGKLTPAVSPAGSVLEPGTRFSRRALELIAQHGLSKETFKDKGLVRERDVLGLVGSGSPSATKTGPGNGGQATSAGGSSPVAAVGVPVRTEELPRMKRIEARYLTSGLQSTLGSVVSLLCPTSGLKTAVADHSELGGSASAIIVYETARLLRKYPVLNAFHEQGRINYYGEVNVGLAMDAGRGLKVPVIPCADKKGMHEIAREIQELQLHYLEDTIPVATLAGGTFTITDLSGEEVLTFHPLINQGQAAILGVGAEYYPPGSSQGFFHLILAFDHQLTEGRLAANFLKDLRDRIRSYEAALRPGDEPSSNRLACSRCLRPVSELTALREPLLEEVRASGDRVLICRRCLVGS
jgi:2-oxoglutarate dehydrogenase E2 component (dihydrolipoamide succinyltransferase)